MNILFLDQYSDIGGAQACLLDLLPAIQARGWTAHVAVPGERALVDRLRSMGVAVREIPCGPYGSGTKSPLDFLRFALDIARQTRALQRLIRRTPFDVIYVNGARLLPAARSEERRVGKECRL